MLRIGEFASLTGISIHMLRNYDKKGLLVPKHVDNDSRYRYYSEDQIIEANRIQILKKLGFGLREIFEINTYSDTMVRELLENKISQKRLEAEQIKQQIHRLRQAIRDMDGDNEWVFSVNIKRLPPRKMVSLRGKIKRFEDEGLLWERLKQKCTENGIKTVNGEYSYAITHGIDREKCLIDTEVQRMISEIPLRKKDLNFYEVPETEVAVVSVKGLYSRISVISAYVYRFIQDTEYEICSVPLRKYLISPEDANDPQQFITEYYFPLKRGSQTS